MSDVFCFPVDQCLAAIAQLSRPSSLQFMEDAAQLICACFGAGNKLLLAGNGGSLCDAAHFAEELTGFFREKRPALPALVLSEPGHLSCTANDLGYAFVFSRGVEAFGKEGDLFIGLTTSGNSPSIVNAFQTAKAKGLRTIAFLGKTGGSLKNFADLELIIDGFSTSDRIQEAHMAAIHLILERVESLLFPKKPL